MRRPAVWPVSGSSQSWTVLPPAARYRREARISAGKPPLATSSTGRGAIRGIIAMRDGDVFMPEMARTDRVVSHPTARSTGPWVHDLVGVHGSGRPVGDDGGQPPIARGRLEQHLAAQRQAEARDPLRVDVGPAREVVETRGDGRLRVVAQAVGVPVALAVAGVVERQHAVAVARQHAHVRDNAPAAAARAVAEQDGRAVARRDVPGREPAPVAHGDADLLVRDADGGLVDRPPRRVRDLVAEREGQQRELGHDRRADDPPGGVGGAPAQAGPARCAARRGDGREAGRDEQQPAHDVADAGDVAPVGARVDDVQPVGDDPEADGDQPDDDAQRDAGRSYHVGLGERPRRRERDDGRDAECRRVGAREGEVEQVRHDEREAGEQERALGTREPLAPAATRAARRAPTRVEPGRARDRVWPSSCPHGLAPRARAAPWKPVEAVAIHRRVGGTGSPPRSGRQGT